MHLFRCFIWSTFYYIITLAPNSTRLAKFCKALAINFNVLEAVSEGVSRIKKYTKLHV
jgi:hypothetical protein